MIGFNEITKKLRELKTKGYIRTHRIGTTGIGKTLEDLLGITENNIPGPNAAMIELKSARKNVSSMLTLFTKSPLPKKANSVLLQKFGYESARGNGRKELHTTVNAIEYNQLKGKPGFKIDIKGDRINLITAQNEIVGYWDQESAHQDYRGKEVRVAGQDQQEKAHEVKYQAK